MEVIVAREQKMERKSIYYSSFKENQIYPSPQHCQSSTQTSPILHPETANPLPRRIPGNVKKEEAEASDSTLPYRSMENKLKIKGIKP
jgi:hypothetical protein